MKKYTYSRTVNLSHRENAEETFTAVEFDSFDEAISAVEKGLYERELKEKERQNKESTLSPNPPATPAVSLDEPNSTATPSISLDPATPADAPTVPGPNPGD